MKPTPLSFDKTTFYILSQSTTTERWFYKTKSMQNRFLWPKNERVATGWTTVNSSSFDNNCKCSLEGTEYMWDYNLVSRLPGHCSYSKVEEERGDNNLINIHISLSWQTTELHKICQRSQHKTNTILSKRL